MTEATPYLTAGDKVLLAVPEDDRSRVGALAGYLVNTSPGWRYSDACRRAVGIYEAGDMQRWDDERQAEYDRIHRQNCLEAGRGCVRCYNIDHGIKI